VQGVAQAPSGNLSEQREVIDAFLTALRAGDVEGVADLSLTRGTPSGILLAEQEWGLPERVNSVRIVRAKEGPGLIRFVSGTMATGVIRQDNNRFENLFFSGMAVLILGTVFLGFARSYYLAGLFKAPLPNLIVHIHGAVFSSWILLLIAQTSLVAAGRVDLHRRLGMLGFALACLVVILGLLAATDSLARHFAAGEPGVGAKAFYAIPVADMLVFSTLIYFAFRERFSPAAHKRLILIATITLLDAAFVRWPILAAWWDLRVAQMCCYALLLLLIGYDLWSTGKIQRATLWASVFLIVLQQVRSPIGRTVPWQSFAAWVQNLARSFR
jgi:hypothetical protein